MQLTYTVRMSDLFWMWLTSWFTPATVAFGLFFISALVAPGDHPRALDVAAGIGLIVAAFTVAPFFWMRITGMTGLVGMSIDLAGGSGRGRGLADPDQGRAAMDEAASTPHRGPRDRPSVPDVHVTAWLGRDPAASPDRCSAGGSHRPAPSARFPGAGPWPKRDRSAPLAVGEPFNKALRLGGPVGSGYAPPGDDGRLLRSRRSRASAPRAGTGRTTTAISAPTIADPERGRDRDRERLVDALDDVRDQRLRSTAFA